MKLWRAAVVGGLAAVLAVGVPGAAQQPAEPTPEQEKTAKVDGDYVADIGLAYQVAAFARGDGDDDAGRPRVASPEGLVTAGAMLLRVYKLTAGKVGEFGVAPTDADGKPVKDGAKKSPDLKAQAAELFDEARALVAGDKAKAAALEVLIKGAEARDYGRGLIGGPKAITMAIAPGQTHRYPVTYIPGAPAAVALKSAGASKLDFQINHAAGGSVFRSKGVFATYNWTPVLDKRGFRPFVITVTNIGNAPTAYTLMSN